MTHLSLEAQIALDQAHIWHPYSAMHSDLPVFHVDSASGVYLTLSDGKRLIDGMSCLVGLLTNRQFDWLKNWWH